VDCVDFNCRGVAPCNVREDSVAACVDNVDNDGDTYVDCADFNCRPLSVCRTTEDAPDTCTDGVDNDTDTFADCADSACAALPVCRNTENAADTCTDGVDNDNDNQTDCADSGCTALPACNVTVVRVATFNIQVLEAPGSAGYDAVLGIIRRVDAHVMCFNEIEEMEDASVAALATAAGYPNRFIGQVSTAMAGGIKNGCLSRLPIVEGASLTSSDISTDTNAHETGRDIVRVRVQVSPGRHVSIFSVHLKSGFETADEVRRQVEMVRAVQAMQQQEARFPNDGMVLLGDFNEEIDGSALGHVYAVPPVGLPQSWNLGSDLSFPITYQPFAMAAQAGLTAADVTQEDSTTFYATRIPSGRRIDYVMSKRLTVLGDEVYNPCRDNGVDDAPPGNYLLKAGVPLACGVDTTASDHRPVVVEFGLP
jgi:endonuclease/exonuclease/phosphatase family metal-dependent hydrolase